MGGSASEVAVGVREGDLLAGKYRIDKILGVGGMGVVVAAHHVRLDEKVAIKFLLPEALGNAEAMARFEREARAAVKIKSEHVARVIDVGTLENGSPYMVMDYLEGRDLGDWIRLSGALPIQQAVEFVLQACEAIAEAHGLGIIHRDLKPANLYVVTRADGLLAVKVLDFGISKVTSLGASGADMGMTKTKAVMGSPLYMSPEQMQSTRDVDARTDIWALGVILYELLTGRVPFNGETFAELVMKIGTAPPESLCGLRADVPPALEAAVLRCLEKDRTKRYANVAELASDLSRFGPKRARASVDRISRVIQTAGLSERPVPSPPSSGDTAAQSSGAVVPTMSSWGHTSPPMGRRGGLIASGVVAVLLIGGAVVAVSRSAGRSEPAAMPAPPSAEPAAASAPVLAAAPQPVAAEKMAAEPAVAAPSAAPIPVTSTRPAPPVARGRASAPVGKPAAAAPAEPAAPPPPQPAAAAPAEPAAPPKNPFNVKLK
jgi:eukaryotic-like serine/threonine-protein kinase